MKINPLKGMKDYLPEEMRLRDYVQGKFLKYIAPAALSASAPPCSRIWKTSTRATAAIT